MPFGSIPSRSSTEITALGSSSNHQAVGYQHLPRLIDDIDNEYAKYSTSEVLGVRRDNVSVVNRHSPRWQPSLPPNLEFEDIAALADKPEESGYASPEELDIARQGQASEYHAITSRNHSSLPRFPTGDTDFSVDSGIGLSENLGADDGLEDFVDAFIDANGVDNSERFVNNLDGILDSQQVTQQVDPKIASTGRVTLVGHKKGHRQRQFSCTFQGCGRMFNSHSTSSFILHMNRQ